MKLLLSLVSAVLLFAADGTGEAQTGTWEMVTPKAAFSPRDTAEAFVHEGRMWLSNGYYHNNTLSRDLWSSADGVDWTLVNGQTPYDGYSEMVIYQKAMWAVKKSVWTSTDGKQWTRVLEQTPFGVRGYGEVVVHDGQMWQLGSGADVWKSRDGKVWECVCKEAPYGARFSAGVVVFRDRLWVMGGTLDAPNTPPEKSYPKKTSYNDVWSSADGVKWERVTAQAAWAARLWFPVEVYRGKMWVLGGFDNAHATNLGDVWFSEDGKEWSPLQTEAGFSPRHEPSVYVHADRLWVVAGNAGEANWKVQNDAWRLALP